MKTPLEKSHLRPKTPLEKSHFIVETPLEKSKISIKKVFVMFERKIEKDLKEWKESLKFKKKAIVIKGLRQVGKTFIIKKFASENFENVIYINFKVETELKKAFDANLRVDEVITNISVLKPGTKFVPGKTVFIFDEVQECAGARACIKPFMEDGRFDIIASGSLLGLRGYNSKYHGGVSIGFEHIVYMKAMDFEEFLWAKGISQETLKYIEECFRDRKEARSPIHEAMLRYFREYICVGGMPAVVDAYLKTDNLNNVLKEQRDILESYKDDFGKHLNEREEEMIDKTLLERIDKVYESIPNQLAKENKKFMYSNLEKKGSSKKYDPAIQWLVDYGLIVYCHNLSIPDSPLAGNKIDGIFKLYVADTGLFIAMLEDDAQEEVLLGNMGSYKGYIYENIVADAFSKMSTPLYYYSKDSGLEIDFVTRYKKNVTLVEVKAKSGNAKSAKTILNDDVNYPNCHHLIKLGMYNVGENGNTLTLPYYMAYLLK